ncbi:MAG: CCXG family PEP-CTERM protein [Oceanospirillaceae bacterium]|nr:CCXG family PEP-CTERM protein [Oceanospirillaceae bacterium]MCP5350356.1 CCXG family PEP-CTERM protein [Oceanospirillaceae bacterium]
MRLVALLLLWALALPSQAYWHCSWPYRTAVNIKENTGTTLNNYQVKITITAANLNSAYAWTGNGYDLRVLDADDNTQLDFWIESWSQSTKTAVIWVRFASLTASQNRAVYLYYGNLFATQLDNVPFTFTDPGIKFHTRRNTVNPNDLTTARSLFNAANDSVNGYGCTFVTNFTGVNNKNLFGNNSNFIAYSETFFEVKSNEAGTWGVRYGSDFGYGGGLYVDGQPLEEDWLNNLWWNNSWTNAAVLQGNINLVAGYHRLEVIGAEDCCDGGITVQYRKPTGPWTTYSTANIDIRSRACPKVEPTVTFGAQATASCPDALAQYRFEETYIGAAGEVKDYTGTNQAGTLLGGATKNSTGKICDGLSVPSNTSHSIIEGMRTGIDINNDVGNQGSIAFWYKSNADWGSDGARVLFDATYDNPTNKDQYFQFRRQSDGRLFLMFEDSADAGYNTRESTLVGRFADTWYHIVVTWDFINNQFAIYVDGVERSRETIVTNGQIGELDKLMIGDNSSSTYTAGSGNSANGTFDEVWIYSYPITVYEAQNLMAITRPCTNSGSCADIFPGGVATASGGKVTLGYNAQVLNSGTQLKAGSLTVNGGSTLPGCGSANCTVDGAGVTSYNLPVFPATSSNTQDLNIGYASSGTLGGAGNNLYRNVNIGYMATLNTNASFTSYYIDNLVATSYSTLNLSPGDYWIRNANFNADHMVINVQGTGVVRLFINNNVTIGSNSLINSPGINTSGTVSKLVVIAYAKLDVGSSSTLSGLFYSADNSSLASPSTLYGAITGKNVDLNTSAQVNYSSVATNANNLPGCTAVSSLASISLNYASVAANCEATPITFSLLDASGNLLSTYSGALNLTVSTAHGDWSKNSAAGTLSQTTADNGAASYAVVAGDGGDFILNLRNTHPETVNFTISDGTTSQSGSIKFQNTAFRFLTNGSVADVPDQLAAKLNTQAPNAATLAIEAIETDTNTGQCKTLLLNTQAIDWAYECISPATCNSNRVQINGTVVGANNSSAVNTYNSVNMDFGNNTTSLAAYTFQYPDVGEIRLHARKALYDQNGVATGQTISGSSNTFVVQPAGFCVRANAAELNAGCASGDANCSVFKNAGTDFAMDVVAVAWQSVGDTDFCDNNITSQFDGDVDLSANLIAPAGGANASLAVGSTTLVAGQKTFNQQISEVGVFSVSAGGNSWLGTTLPVSTSVNIGRFIPARFVRSATADGTFTSGCAGFTYTGQVDTSANGVIAYDTLPSLTLEPQNQAGIAVQNYTGSFVKSPQATLSASSAQLGSDGITPLNVGSLLNAGSVGTINPGSFMYQLNNADRFYYVRDANAQINPFTNDIQLNISAFSDSDGVTSTGLPWVISPVGGEIRYGRMRLGNQYGPETSSLSMPLYLEYLDAQGFQLNTSDSCYAYNSSNAALSNYTDSLLSGDVAISGAGTVSSGSGNLLLSAPLNGHAGSARVTYDAPAWLEYDFDKNGSADNPYGIATFGRYRGHDKIIYWKELNY